jgi:hypothetical protein
MAGNIYQTGMDAYKDSYLTQRTMGEDRQRIRGARALASGNRTQAAAEYGAGGLTDDVRGVQRDQEVVDQADLTRQRQGKQDSREAAAERYKVLSTVAQGLKHIPPGQRKAALDHAMPIFQSVDPDPDGPDSLVGHLRGITEDQLDDATLDSFSGELEKAWQGVNLGNGGFAQHNARTGEFKLLREPDKVIVLPNGATAVSRNGDVIAKSPKTFAPPRASGGGVPATHGAGLDTIETELRKRGLIP